MFKVNYRNTRTRFETNFTPCSSVSIVNFDQVKNRANLRQLRNKYFIEIRLTHSWSRKAEGGKLAAQT